MESFITALLSLFILLVIAAPVALIFTILDLRAKNKSPSEYDLEQQYANLELVLMLEELTAKYPTLRFGQILHLAGITQNIVVQRRGQEEWESGDVYFDRILLYESSKDILERAKKTLADLKD